MSERNTIIEKRHVEANRRKVIDVGRAIFCVQLAFLVCWVARHAQRKSTEHHWAAFGPTTEN